MSTTNTGNIRFEDWRAKAVQLRQAYQTANTAFADARRAAVENPTLFDAAHQAGLQAHEAARAYNSLLAAGTAASKLSADIYNRLNAQGGPALSPADRQALESQRRQLNDFAADFGGFLAQQQLRPVWPEPVNKGGKTTYADGRSEWDYTARGLWGRVVEAGAAFSTAVGEAFRGAASSVNNFETCKYAWEQVQGALLKGPLPAPGGSLGWQGAISGQLFEDIANKSFPNSPAEAMCRLIWPKSQVPEILRLQGSITDGVDPTLGELTALDVPASKLATAAVGAMLAEQVARGVVGAAEAASWLRDVSGDPTAALPVAYAAPSSGLQVAGALPLELDLTVWTDGGPMGGTPWARPTQSVGYAGNTTTWQETDLWGDTTTTVTQVFDDGSSLTTTQLSDGTVRTVSRDTDDQVWRVVDEQVSGATRTLTTSDGAGTVLHTQRLQVFDDGSSSETLARPDGSETRILRDFNGVELKRIDIPGYAQTFTGAVQDTTSILNALKAGAPDAVVAVHGLERLNGPSGGLAAGSVGVLPAIGLIGARARRVRHDAANDARARLEEAA